MGNVINKATVQYLISVNTPNAMSVPALRIEVARLAEAVEALQNIIKEHFEL